MPKKNKPSDYLMSDPAPLPDFSRADKVMTPKMPSKQFVSGVLSPSNYLSPMSGGPGSDNTFVPFV